PRHGARPRVRRRRAQAHHQADQDSRRRGPALHGPARFAAPRVGGRMIGKTVAEKILSRVSLRAQGPLARDARAGDLVIVPISRVMVHDSVIDAVMPGMGIVGSDSRSNSYGAVGAFGAGMGATDIAVALALGRTWLRVPQSIKVTFSGRPRKGVTMKDAVMRVVREIGTDGARYACVE